VCYWRSLQVADTLGARSVAFPAIATGIYGYPPGQAARIAVRTIRSAPTTVECVRLVAFDQPTRDVLEAALSA
jgi:O-acetyl-ADP-ribose deacetylase